MAVKTCSIDRRLESIEQDVAALLRAYEEDKKKKIGLKVSFL